MHRSTRFHPLGSRIAEGMGTALLCVVLAVAASFLAPSQALAANAPASRASAAGSAANACILTEEQRAAYEADGTLQARIAYQESLGNDSVSPDLVQQAIQRQNKENGIATLDVPSRWQGGMASVGSAHVLVLRVSFPGCEFAADDTLEALQAGFGPKAAGEDANPSAAAYPYESLSAYYHCSSYGKLDITAEAFDYTALHPRDHYTNNEYDLFVEAVAALDEQLDLAGFDANRDGILDCVYLHFAGEDGGWGSSWWSNQRLYTDGERFEGGTVRIGNAVMLHQSAASASSVQTIIHETGHVLGLPDLYSYHAAAGPTSERTGALTFDMMDSNLGDHNGYFKWLLNWLDADKITRVVANDGGITVKRGTDVIQHVPAGAGGAASVDLELEGFTSSDPAETGGIIVVSNEDGGLFSSFYLLQYDHCAGNQSVRYRDYLSWQFADIPSGFRLFRVQGELDGEGADYAHSNANGSVFDQLVELVDPDMDEEHSPKDDFAPPSSKQGGYGCMLQAGDRVTPTSYPSSNFRENINLGFTGLGFAVIESAEDRGAVEVSHSSVDKPVVPDGLELTYAGNGMSNDGVLVFDASTQPTPVPSSSSGVGAGLLVDGVYHPLSDPQADGLQVRIPFSLNASDVRPSSKCEAVFPAGMFLLAETPEGPVYSEELRVPVDPADFITAVDGSGFYADTVYAGWGLVRSEVFAASDGTRRFFQLVGDTWTLHTLDAEDPSKLSALALADGLFPPVSPYAVLHALPLSGSTVFLGLSDTAAEYPVQKGFWIDVESGAVLASSDMAGLSGSGSALAATGSTVVCAWPYYSDAGELSSAIVSFTLRDGAVETRYGWSAAAGVASAGGDAIAFALADEARAQRSIRVMSADALAGACRFESVEAARAAGESCSPEQAQVTLAVPAAMDMNSLRSVGASSAGYCALFGASESSTALRFDAQGCQRGGVEVADGSGHPYRWLTMRDDGSFALVREGRASAMGLVTRTARFYDASSAFVSQLTTYANVGGSWLQDGRWLDIGCSVDLPDGEDGLYYTVAAPVPEAPAPDPPTPDDPQPDNGGAAQDENAVPPGGKALASTGDGTAAATAAVVAAAVAAVVAGAAATAALRAPTRNSCSRR